MPTKPVIPIKPLTSWSFTRYNDYKGCPFRFYNKHILKIQEPPNAAMERGTNIHKMAEDYTKGLIKVLPKELANFKEEFTDLRKMYKSNRHNMVVEDNWGFKKDWSETSTTDWNGCWLRIKMDLTFQTEDTLHIVDHKTGRNSPYKNVEYAEQCELYALAALIRMPHIVEARPRLWYLDAGELYPGDDDVITYTQADVPRLRKLWEGRVKPMFTAKTFKPTPSKACEWCYYRKANAANGGGQCKY